MIYGFLVCVLHLVSFCFSPDSTDSVFRDTTSFNSTRSLDQLAAFLKTFSPDNGSSLSMSSEETGTPHTLVISPAALRAAEVVR